MHIKTYRDLLERQIPRYGIVLRVCTLLLNPSNLSNTKMNPNSCVYPKHLTTDTAFNGVSHLFIHVHSENKYSLSSCLQLDGNVHI